MHLKPATSTHIQPHNEQDMGFSMHLHSGEREGFFFSQPVIIDLATAVKIMMKIIYHLKGRTINPVFILDMWVGENK